MPYIPCKRCGSEQIRLRRITFRSWDENEPEKYQYFVQCTECGKVGTLVDTPERAEFLWNKNKKKVK